MSAQRIFALSLLAALTLIGLTASYALGCTPDDNDSRRCLRFPKNIADFPGTPIPISLSALNQPVPTGHTAPPAQPVPAKPQTGADPNNAIEPDGTWRFIQPNTTLWYKMTDARLTLEIWVDANGQNGLALAVFAPNQTDLYGNPIGRGSYNKFIPEHDLFWTGRSAAWGTWYATLTNRSSTPISFSLNYRRVAKYTKDFCAVCHGWIIDFDDCEDRGGNFCGDLQDSYR